MGFNALQLLRDIYYRKGQGLYYMKGHYWKKEETPVIGFYISTQAWYLEGLMTDWNCLAGINPQRFKRLSLTYPMSTVQPGDFVCCACSPCSVLKWIPIDLGRFHLEYGCIGEKHFSLCYHLLPSCLLWQWVA